MKETIYWLGAHKTGTTFLQESLNISQKALRDHQVTYLKLDEFRKKYTRPLLNIQRGVAETSVYKCDGEGENLIFDENIPALVQHACGPGGLYPEGPVRARKIAKHLGLEKPTLVLGIRGMAGYIPSLYCETLKANPFRPFREFLTTPLEKLRWYPYIKSLQAAFPDSPMWVYQHKTLSGNERNLLSRITGIAAGEFNLPAKWVRPGFSHPAIVAMLKIHKIRTVTNKDLRAAIKKFPKGADFPAFTPWLPEEIELLDWVYMQDMKEIQADSSIELLLDAG